MKTKLRLTRFSLAIALTLAALAAHAQSELREWTSTDGRTVRARILEKTDAGIVLARADGVRFIVPIDSISFKDQVFVEEWQKAKPEKVSAQKPAAPALGAEELARRADGKSYRYSGRHFKVIYEKLNWEDAGKRCKELGGRLAILRESRERERILGKLLKDTQCAWLGAIDEDLNGSWFWVDGAPVESTVWAPRNPYPGGGQKYMVGRWDGWCGSAPNDLIKLSHIGVGFICEWTE